MGGPYRYFGQNVDGQLYAGCSRANLHDTSYRSKLHYLGQCHKVVLVSILGHLWQCGRNAEIFIRPRTLLSVAGNLLTARTDMETQNLWMGIAHQVLELYIKTDVRLLCVSSNVY